MTTLGFFTRICLLAAPLAAACPSPPHPPEQPANRAALRRAIEQCQKQGRDDAARENCKVQALYDAALQESIETCKAEHCPDKKLGYLETKLGLRYMNSMDAVNAEKHFRIAVACNRRARGTEDADTAISIDNLALALTEQGRVDESIPLHREACTILEKLSGPDSRDLAICLTGLGKALAKNGNSQSAFEVSKRAFRILSPRLNDSREMEVLLSVLNDLEARSDRLQVSLPGKRWFLSASEFPDLKILMNNTTKPRDERFVLGTHAPSGVTISVRLKQMPVGSARACRESTMASKDAARQEQGIRISDKEDFSEMEYQTESESVMNGIKTRENHHNVVRFLFHDDTCIVVHVSKWNYTTEDKPIFDRIFNTVTISTLAK